MVVLFVVAMVLTFLLIDYAVQVRQAKLAPATSAAAERSASARFAVTDAGDFFVPQGVFMSNNHLWYELEPQGRFRLGITPFLKNALGEFSIAEKPAPGDSLNQGDSLLAISSNNTTLSVASAIPGRVVSVNPNYHGDKDWLLEIEPESLSDAVKQFKVGDDMKAWVRKELTRLREFVADVAGERELAYTMQDGGLPVQGIVSQFDENVMKEFQNQFLR